MAATVARRLAAARDGDPMEFDQFKVRFAIYMICVVYLLASFFWDRTLTVFVYPVIITLSLTAADFAWMLLRPGINHPRRRAVVLDVGEPVMAGEAQVEEHEVDVPTLREQRKPLFWVARLHQLDSACACA